MVTNITYMYMLIIRGIHYTCTCIFVLYRAEQAELEKRLKDLESKVIVGGVNLVSISVYRRAGNFRGAKCSFKQKNEVFVSLIFVFRLILMVTPTNVWRVYNCII